MRIGFAAATAIAIVACSASVAIATTFADLIRITTKDPFRGKFRTICTIGSAEAGVIYHQGGYVAEIHLWAPDEVTGTILRDQCAHIKSTAPNGVEIADAIRIYSHTGLVWAPTKLFYAGPIKGRCLYLSGTTLEPNAVVKSCSPN